MIIRNALISSRKGSGLWDIHIENGIITSITASSGTAIKKGTDAEGRVVIPGMIDPHVHMRCPGMEQKEDWISGSRAAIAGGVTTVIDMPNTKPATETLEALALKREAASKADNLSPAPRRFYWAGCSPENLEELPELLSENDVAGLKLFFSDTSANRSSSDIDFISRVFSIAAEAGKPVAVHSELGALISPELKISSKGMPPLVQHNHRRPAGAAVAGTALALELSAVSGCRLYLCHLSTMPEFAMVRKHKQAYGRDSVFAELTPHHLLLDENHSVKNGFNSWAKVNPPLRAEADRIAAAEALLDGTIDLIGSDHAPHRLDEKDENTRDFHDCPSGFPGLETELGLAAGFLKHHYPDGWVESITALTSSRAAEIFGLSDSGEIAEGERADLVILDGPETIVSSSFKTKAKYSPFNGMKMPVSVYKTIAGGKIGK